MWYAFRACLKFSNKESDFEYQFPTSWGKVNQRRIYNPAKHLWWNFAKILYSLKSLTIFTENLHQRCLTEAVAQICSVKKVLMFLEILQNLQESTCARASFLIKLQAWGLRPSTLLKRLFWHRDFPVNFAKFLRIPFLTEHLRWLLLARQGFWKSLCGSGLDESKSFRVESIQARKVI